MVETEETGLEIAVIGMAGRFPGAGNIDRFWKNLKNGVESITFYSGDELREAGVDPGLLEDPDYVKCGGGILENKEYFDASFFGYNPAEAEVMDPQMRIFHECAYHALEDAGYNPAAYDGLIGLFAGASFSLAWEALVLSSGKLETLGQFAGALWIDRDYLCTRVSYRLDLKGPSVVVKTACSTSLVAVHMACRSLLTGECDISLAGGVTVTSFEKAGYLYQEGKINSPDGHCRAFDAQAKGTVAGSGVGIVVLKRLEAAVEDRDHIYAVVKGSAINNDGLRKAGYTTPSVEGQAEVIKMAQQAAEIEPESIGYIEAHGTGTELGDPVEIEGMKLAFDTDKKQFCSIGSVKTNVGHLDSAAGIAGFIKAALMLKYKQIPPTINFKAPNPKIDFKNSPFYVNAKPGEWRREKYPLRAGVSSFGIGGTNAHVILEEWPETEPTPLGAGLAPARGSSVFDGQPQGLPLQPSTLNSSTPQLILLSAKTQPALDKVSQNLAGHLEKNPHINIADAAYTLQVGRKAFEHKKFFLCSSVEEMVNILKSPQDESVNTFYSKESSRPIVFMFPGQGAQYVNMGLGLYRTEPVFREEIDRCFGILKPIIGFDLKEILYPPKKFDDKTQSAAPAERGGLDINQTSITQPLIFTIEYALAKLMMSWGITPYAMTGHSIGEYAAACLSGVFSLEDALKVTALRGRLMQKMPPGTMLSVSLPEEELRPLLSRDISLAAVNSTYHCVVSGTSEAVETFAARLKEMGHRCRPLITSHAFHSGMMDPILAEFEESLEKVRLGKPEMPYISDVTGQWISTMEATDPRYWARHIRETVNFRDGLSRLLEKKDALFIEVGPGNVLSTFLRQHKDKRADHFVLNLVRHPREDIPDEYYLLNKIGQCLLFGVNIDWNGFYAEKKRRRLSLPGYPFEGRRFFIETAPVSREAKGVEEVSAAGKSAEPEKSRLHPRPPLTKPYAEPRSDTERKLASVWQNFFGFQSLGIDDNFFELGGDSLNAAAIIARIHREFGVRIPLAEVFNAPYIRELSSHIERGAKSRYTDIEAAEKKEYYPLSPAQRRLYILHEFEKDSIAYNMPVILSVVEELQKDKLEQTFRKLIERHGSLRTSFGFIYEEAVQLIHDRVDFEIEYFEAVSEPTPSSCSYDGIIERFVRPFDLSKAPLLRVGIIEEKGASYVLMVDIHHIVTDGTSQDLLVRDFAVLYSDAALLPFRLQYKDYSQWRQSPEMHDVLVRQETFWLQEFTEEVSVLDLPTDYPRPPVQSFAGRQARFELSSEVTKGLSEIAHSENATLFMVTLAVYKILLMKLSGQEDIVVGTATAGRKHTDLESIIGMFVNTLALRSYPSGEKSFKQFLKEVREKTINAFENDGFQFEDLLEKLDVKRDMSRNPLFDVMFVLQNFYDASGVGTVGQTEDESLKIKPYPFEPGVSKFDLTLTVSERGEELVFRLEYCTRLFREETIHRFIQYFKNLSALLVKNPGKKVAEIEIIPEPEKQRLLVEFNDTGVDFPVGKRLHELFEDQAERIPDHSALVFADTHRSYRHLNDSADRQAGVIRAAGVHTDHIAGLMVETGPEMVIGMTAIMKAGGAYLPIDPAFPGERKDYLLRDSAARLLVTTRNLTKEVKELKVSQLEGEKNGAHGNLRFEIIFIDDQPTPPFGHPSREGIFPGSAGGFAYVIYTSGTTGKPKGVPVRHDNITNQLYGLQKRYAFESGLHHILLAPFTFDPSVQQVFLPLISGGKLHVIPKSLKEDPAVLFSYIVSHCMDIVNTVPSVMELMMNFTADYKNLHFKYIILAGEIFSAALYRKIRDVFSVDRLINIYGPTEAAINTTLYECGGEETVIPIGKPLMNYQVFILDKYLNLQPVGATGEVCIAGAGIAAGYLNNPELTAEKFVDIASGGPPFWKKVGPKTFVGVGAGLAPARDSHQLLYKTGDLGKWLPDGNLQFSGRADQQVKIRGIRVELEEIENQLLAHPGIKKTVIISKKYKADSTDLCAYYVGEPDLGVSELRGFLQAKLPDYMVPSYFLQLEEIPLTKHGKVDLKKLPEIGPGNIKLETEYVPPDGEMEKAIAAIWQDILQLDKVGIDDNFFDLGGNSLDIIKVNSRLKGVSDKSLSVVLMFKYPTIRSLTTYFSRPGEEHVSTKIDRSNALERGESGRDVRRQMRKKTRK